MFDIRVAKKTVYTLPGSTRAYATFEQAMRESLANKLINLLSRDTAYVAPTIIKLIEDGSLPALIQEYYDTKTAAELDALTNEGETREEEIDDAQEL